MPLIVSIAPFIPRVRIPLLALQMKELISYYSLRVVQAYMGHIQDAADIAVREMLRDLSRSHNLAPIADMQALDFMVLQRTLVKVCAWSPDDFHQLRHSFSCHPSC